MRQRTDTSLPSSSLLDFEEPKRPTETPDLFSTRKPKSTAKRGVIPTYGAKAWAGVTSFFGAVGEFISNHKFALGVTALALVGGAVFAAGIVLFWPGIVAAAAALTVTLPTLGAVAPLAWLATLSLPAAAAALGGLAAVGGVVAGGALYAGANFLVGAVKFAIHMGKSAKEFFSGRVPTDTATKGDIDRSHADLLNEFRDIVHEENEEVEKHLKKDIKKAKDTVEGSVLVMKKSLKGQIAKLGSGKGYEHEESDSDDEDSYRVRKVSQPTQSERRGFDSSNNNSTLIGNTLLGQSAALMSRADQVLGLNNNNSNNTDDHNADEGGIKLGQ